jgi:hypothetical protein
MWCESVCVAEYVPLIPTLIIILTLTTCHDDGVAKGGDKWAIADFIWMFAHCILLLLRFSH